MFRLQWFNIKIKIKQQIWRFLFAKSATFHLSCSFVLFEYKSLWLNFTVIISAAFVNFKCNMKSKLNLFQINPCIKGFRIVNLMLLKAMFNLVKVTKIKRFLFTLWQSIQNHEFKGFSHGSGQILMSRKTNYNQ